MSEYKEIKLSQDGLEIPVLDKGKTLNSRYSALKESLNFIPETKENNNFIFILGIAGGYHIKNYLQNNTDKVVIAVENSDEDLDFLKQIKSVQELADDKRVHLTTCDKLYKDILELYKPAVFGGIEVIPYIPWTNHFKDTAQKAISIIHNAIKEVSKDYSVQSHFGYLWHKNIMQNLKTLDMKENSLPKSDSTKTAVIVAAGPSLDNIADRLKLQRDKYYIISTDTAFSSLEKRGIDCDAVVSIDPQNISMTHFIGRKIKNKVFVLDCGCNASLSNYIISNGGKLFFTHSGHPLALYSNHLFPELNIPYLTSGTGTVTISALDFARILGFKNILVAGADFSYFWGKAYAKGTYLDTLYYKTQTRIKTAENDFNRLIYRTNLERIEAILFGKRTVKQISPVLNDYKKAFVLWLDSNEFEWELKDCIYYCFTKKDYTFKSSSCLFDSKAFIRELIKDIDNLQHETCLKQTGAETAILPLIAYLRAKNPQIHSYSALVKLARSLIVEYT